MARSVVRAATVVAEQLYAELRPKLFAPPRARYSEAREMLSDLWDEELALIADRRPPSAPERLELTREAWERCVTHEFITMEWLGDTRTRFAWIDAARHVEDLVETGYVRSGEEWLDRPLPMSVQAVVSFAADAQTIESARALCRVLLEADPRTSCVPEIASKLLRIRVDRAPHETSALFSLAYANMAKGLFTNAELEAMAPPRAVPLAWGAYARTACIVEAIAAAHQGPAYETVVRCAAAIRALFAMGLGVEIGFWSKRPGTFLRVTLPLPA